MTTIPVLSDQQLRRAGRSIATPFQLQLTDCNEPLICEQVVRILPKKRLVVFGALGNKKVVAKLFLGPKAQQSATRDAKGVKGLLESGIPTPELYYRGMTKGKKIEVLLFKKITNAMDFQQLQRNRVDAEILTTLLHALTLELATQHVLGVLQQDLHFKNFLFADDKIYTLDGGDIEKFDYPLSKKISLTNLALLIAQLGVDAEAYQEELFIVYAQSRGWQIKGVDYLFLKRTIQEWQKKRWADFDKKTLRNCTSFIQRSTATSFIVYDRNSDSTSFRQFLQNPNAVFSEAETTLLKNGNTATVIKAIVDQHDRVIKRYNIKNFWHGLRRCLRPTRAMASWRLAQYLCLMGVPTAKPTAFIEKRILGLRTKSYFVMDYIDGPHVGEYFAKANLQDSQTEAMVEKIVTLFKNLAQLRLLHGDLKMTNILIHNDEPVLIDLDGMREYRWKFGFKRALRNEWNRFLKNWDNQPTVRKLFERSYR